MGALLVRVIKLIHLNVMFLQKKVVLRIMLMRILTILLNQLLHWDQTLGWIALLLAQVELQH